VCGDGGAAFAGLVLRPGEEPLPGAVGTSGAAAAAVRGSTAAAGDACDAPAGMASGFAGRVGEGAAPEGLS